MFKQLFNDVQGLNAAIGQARKSTCLDKQVGAVLIDEGQGRLVLNEAFNYSLLGCAGALTQRESFCFQHNGDKCPAIHAEQLLFRPSAQDTLLPGETLPPARLTVYTTLSPCLNCIKFLISRGVKRIVSLVTYSKHISAPGQVTPEMLLASNNVVYAQINQELVDEILSRYRSPASELQGINPKGSLFSEDSI